MPLTVKNNMAQVLHTTAIRAGKQVTLIMPPYASAVCDAATPLLNQHAKSRMVTLTGTPVAAPSPTPAPISAFPEVEPPSPAPTNGGPSKATRRSV